jgi:hypothetical protein
MRLLRMQSEDGIYRGGKLLGNRLVVSELFERSEKSNRVCTSEAGRAYVFTLGPESKEEDD